MISGAGTRTEFLEVEERNSQSSSGNMQLVDDLIQNKFAPKKQVDHNCGLK